MVTLKHGPVIDYRQCNGCHRCYDNCPDDVFGWDEVKGLPIVAYPDECHYCDICVLECSDEAIHLDFPIQVLLDLGVYPRDKNN
ncbi:MAG: ferredoxin family protein [Deltaproteobacteria bacterium]|nr:ferredoxin family protein [Deltaproteobacteria bacterium]MBW2137274.1 ferredoxin family protein [Deltaproteobacteria bacterium]